MTLQNNYNGALQQPLGTGFNAQTTTTQVIKGINLSGKIAMVTGGYAGIGLETVKTLVKAGAQVTVPVRNRDKALTNLEGLPNVQIEEMNLMEPASIQGFARKFLASHDRLHILINNAGIMWAPLRRDQYGYESQFSTNHLGHFLLTAMLWPALKNAQGARVVNVSSFGHQYAPFDFDDPHFLQKDYESLIGYGQSKTANNLFTVELDHRGKQHGVRTYAVHPGAVGGTGLGREAPVELFQQMGLLDEQGNLKASMAAGLKTIEQGAATSVWAATSPLLKDIGGVYCEDADIAVIDNGQAVHEYDDPKTQYGVKPYSLDQVSAKRLWALSERWSGSGSWD